jgi:pimeloyl-ACP methyl ester carboxylesterase
MPKARVNGEVELCYEEFGQGEPLILIMGIGVQLVLWEVEFCERLAARGFRVVRFDNRDVGHSTRLEALGMPDMRAALLARVLGRPAQPPYTLDDMARDTFGLMDALGMPSAHVVGLSLGGMVAQCMALNAPERVRSLGLLMTSPGDLWCAVPSPSGLATLLNRPVGLSREGILEHMTNTWVGLGASPHRTPRERLRALSSLAYERGLNPKGFARQFAAVMAAPARSERLRALRVPSVVIHGADDPLIPTLAGRVLGARIPDARLHVVAGLGHDLGPSIWPFTIDAIDLNARRTPAPGARPMGLPRALTQRAQHVGTATP